MSKKDFVKINIQDLEIAENFFENDKHFNEWLINVFRYYRGKEITIKTKIVSKYFETYKKTMDFIIEAKLSGTYGATVKAENEKVRKLTLEGSLKGSLEAKKKEEIIKSKELIDNLNPDKYIVFNKWLDYRKEISKPITVPSTLKALVKKFNTEPLVKIEYVINSSIENNWVGLFWDKYKEETPKSNYPKPHQIV